MSSSFISDRLKHRRPAHIVRTRKWTCLTLSARCFLFYLLSVNTPDVVIGQLGDEGGLCRGEEEEAASSSSNTSCPSDTVNVLCRRRRWSVLYRWIYLLLHTTLSDHLIRNTPTLGGLLWIHQMLETLVWITGKKRRKEGGG